MGRRPRSRQGRPGQTPRRPRPRATQPPGGAVSPWPLTEKVATYPKLSDPPLAPRIARVNDGGLDAREPSLRAGSTATTGCADRAICAGTTLRSTRSEVVHHGPVEAWLAPLEILLEPLFSHIRGTIESLTTWATRILGGQHGLFGEPTPIAGFPPSRSPRLDLAKPRTCAVSGVAPSCFWDNAFLLSICAIGRHSPQTW